MVRLQTGDPALYGALIEMARPLSAAGIEWAVVPGVSSAMAAMAAAGESLTLPEVTQTVVLTRVAGRTTLRSIAVVKPGTLPQLSLIHGVGAVKLQEYGADVLYVVREFQVGGAGADHL